MSKVTREAAPLRQQVLRLIREDILNGTLAPGERLREQDLCDAYAVSRTVIREALRQLESEKLVEVIPNRGPVVKVLSQRDIEAVYEVRRVLEGLAGELFAQNASPDQAAALLAHLDTMERTFLNGTIETREAAKERFYELLLDGAGNEVLVEDLRAVHGRIALFRRYAFADEQRVVVAYGELRQIVQLAAVERDPVGARNACERHIALAGQLALLEYSRRVALGVPTNVVATRPRNYGITV